MGPEPEPTLLLFTIKKRVIPIYLILGIGVT
ncbi:hypothetical protein ZORO111903_16545 [Zobellia roscoffensis]